MPLPRISALQLAVATVLLSSANNLAGGQTPTSAPDSAGAQRVTAVPGPQYRAGGFTRILLGDGWRDVWITPVSAPILDPATALGGLKFDKRGGGRQTITVHFTEEQGWRGHVWRSVDKFPMNSLSREFQGNLAGRIIQDQISSFLPAAPMVVAPLLRAVGILDLESDLYVMARSPRIGALRDTVGGLLGTFEVKPNEAPDDKPGFGGSKKVQDTDEFLEKLREGHNDQLDEREFLVSRLIDIIINDPDRAPDNYAWARFGNKEKGYTWRVIPRDRDWAFIDADGLVNKFVATPMYPKYTKLTHRPKLSALTYTSHLLDRQLLQRLTIRDFQDAALFVQRSITDQVIARAVSELPVEWQQAGAASRLTEIMRARRDNIVATAMEFYRDLAEDVDLRGTDIADRVEVVRHNDGRVTVTIGPAQPTVVASQRRENDRVVTETGGEVAGTRDTYYERTFTPPETHEIRVYLGKGDDVAVVRGAANKSITLRFIGEEGNDVFTDSAYAGGTRFYDQEGNNRVIAGPALNTKPFEGLVPRLGLRLGTEWRPDWGGKHGMGFGFDHKTGAGIIIGAGPKFTTYGFRHMPHELKGRANLMVAPKTGQLGVYGSLDYRFENSPKALTLDARATQIEGVRFFGYGNDTPDVGSSASLVDQRVVTIDPAFVYRIGWRARENGYNEIRGGTGNPEEGEDSLAPPRRIRVSVGKLTVGPTLSWIDPEDAGGSPLAVLQPLGAHSFALAGLKGTLQIDRTDDDAMPTSGFTVRAAAAGYPMTMGSLDGPFGTLSASTSAYIPIMSGGTHFAIRLGGATGVGDVPFQFAPAIGGRSSLRGFSSRRFTGDASANAGVEFRVPVGELNFILRSKVGVFALADAGRVWLDGASPGGVHTGVGGGLWFASLGRSVSIAYAQGEAGKLYLKLGQSY